MKDKKLGKKEIDFVKKSYSLKRAVVIPTDTIYGITVQALEKKNVESLYKLKKRKPEKPFIILISSIKDLFLFGIEVRKEELEWIKKIWPKEITVIVPCQQKEFQYLHRNKKALAVRLPDNKWLIRLIKDVGPIVASSANIEGKRPAETIKDAYEYFGDNVDYVDGGILKSKPSTIVSFENNEFTIIRQGSYKLKKNEYFGSGVNN